MGVLSWFTPGALAAHFAALKVEESAAPNASVGGGPPNHATPLHKHMIITP
jgi:hypothetical protein